MNKYSAAFWGTSFVREMTKLDVLPELPPTPPTNEVADGAKPAPAVNGVNGINGRVIGHNNGIVNGVKSVVKTAIDHIKGGQAELTTNKEDTVGSTIVDGAVPPTPPINAPAPAANSA